MNEKKKRKSLILVGNLSIYLRLSNNFSFFFLEVMMSLANLNPDRPAVHHQTADLKLDRLFH